MQKKEAPKQEAPKQEAPKQEEEPPKKGKKMNRWFEFLAQFRKNNPEIKGKQVMKQAKIEYDKSKN